MPATTLLEELLDEETIEEELLELTLELLLELTVELDELLGALELPPTMPKGAGCELQVLREIQLLLLSQPQPLVVVTQSG